MQKPKVQNRSTKHDAISRDMPAVCASELAAVEFMEGKRWGDSPHCPVCGSLGVYKMMHLQGKQRQANYRWRCKDCSKQYTVRVGTVFEDSRIELRHWCYAFWRASTSKKGVSALEIHRQTGISYKSCLFMLHRIRFAMSGSVTEPLKGRIEADETYVGGKPRYKGISKSGQGTNKKPVLALVERGGKVIAKRIPNLKGETIKPIIRDNVDQSSTIISDKHGAYKDIGMEYEGGHWTLRHRGGKYVSGQVHSNTAEGFFSILKRGIDGIYHSVSVAHLPSYLNEFEFRYNWRELEDGERVLMALKGAEGKHLSYREHVK